jgi:hypothetical protein
MLQMEVLEKSIILYSLLVVLLNLGAFGVILRPLRVGSEGELISVTGYVAANARVGVCCPCTALVMN